jgi:Flp pilus assembly CpaE family ATPase
MVAAAQLTATAPSRAMGSSSVRRRKQMTMVSADRTIDAGCAASLAFRTKGGPLVGVAALCGGAGASSLALLTAIAAARSSEAPVLVCDTGGASGGLACYAGTESRYSLAVASERLVAGARVCRDELFALSPHGVRVLAVGPEADADGDRGVVTRLLSDARHAHGLTVVDCGTLGRPLQRHALEQATHVLWVLPATLSGVRRAERVLDIVPPYAPGRETVVARHDAGERTPPMRQLASLADDRGGPLVLMPHIPDLAEAAHEDALDAADIALQAIGAVLRR